MNKLYIIALLVLLFFLNACGGNRNWSDFQGKGLPMEMESYDVLNFDETQTLFLGGNKTVDVTKLNEDYTSRPYCVIYRSSDLGRTWTQIFPDSIEGSIKQIKISKESIVVLNHHILQDSSSIYSSEDNGRTWKKVLTCFKDYYFYEPGLRKDNTVIALANSPERRKFAFRISENKIDTIKFQEGLDKAFISEKGFIGIIADSTRNVLVFLNEDGKVTNKFKLKSGYLNSPSKLNSKNEIILFDSYVTNKFQIIRNREIKEINLNSFKNFKIIEPYVEDSLIIVMGYYRKDVAFLGVIHTALVSKDFGKTWKEEEIPDPLYAGPVALQNGRFISYSGICRFQERISSK